jgi:NADH dehydrogenase [ubiquinone] 1 alpha subcomplex assembly factor 5
MEIFDRQILRKNRDRVAGSIVSNDFIIKDLFVEAAERIAIHRDSFENVLNLGSRVFNFAELSKGRLSINTLISADLSKNMVERIGGYNVQADEECLPFRDASFDLIVSVLNLHYINDLPGTLIQINRALKKGGIFFANFIGEDSLKEMRQAFVSAELKHCNGVYLRVPPMIEAKTLSDLMKRAYFSNIIIDKEEIRFSYSDPKQIFTDIKNIGESSCFIKKSGYIGAKLLRTYYQCYYKDFSSDNEVVCSYDLISLLAIKPGG